MYRYGFIVSVPGRKYWGFFYNSHNLHSFISVCGNRNNSTLRIINCLNGVWWSKPPVTGIHSTLIYGENYA